MSDLAEASRFRLESRWIGGRMGQGEVQGRKLAAHVSIPAELGGPDEGTNPEELLLAASASCYLITLAGMLEREGLLPRAIELESWIEVERVPTLHIQKIGHIVAIQGPSCADVTTQQRLVEQAKAAKSRCMISRALARDVAVEVRVCSPTSSADARGIQKP